MRGYLRVGVRTHLCSIALAGSLVIGAGQGMASPVTASAADANQHVEQSSVQLREEAQRVLSADHQHLLSQIRQKKQAEVLAIQAHLGRSESSTRVSSRQVRAHVTTPFNQCPAIGDSPSCGVLVDITPGGTDIYIDPSVGPFDGDDDTLYGVQNDSGSALDSIVLASDAAIFAFDGDGICSGDYGSWTGSAGCPYGPTGYEGPNTSFSDINAEETGGVVNFSPPVAPGGSAYFSLEAEVTPQTLVIGGGPSVAEQGGAPNFVEHFVTCNSSDPVNCATGTYWQQYGDVSVPGRGAPLQLTRTYSSADATNDGPFGYGWSDSYGMHIGVVPQVGSWTNPETDYFDTDGTPNDISCTSETYCVAVDNAGYAWIFDGASWQSSDIDGTTDLLSVSCAAQGSCVAVDATGNALELADGAWTSNNIDGTTALDSISCVSSSYCIAVDADGDALTYSGGSWSSDDIDGTTQLSSISCTSDTFCVAADDLGNVVSFDGTKWTATDVDGSASLDSVSCASTTFCVAVDDNGNAVTFNGALWTASDIDGSSQLNGVSCGSATLCVAVDTAGNELTYNGSWTAQSIDTGASLEAVSCVGSTFCATTDSYGSALTTSATATVQLEDGSAVTFNESGLGQWQSAPWVLASLVTNSDGTFTFTPDDGLDSYNFSPDGVLMSETDTNGYVTTLAYNGSGQLISVTDASGRSMTFTYSGAHIATVTDPMGRVWSYAYDSSGNLTEVTDPSGATWSFSYDSNHLLLTSTDPLGHIQTNVYNGAGEVTSQTDPLGQTTTWAYSGNPASATGGVTVMTDPFGVKTAYSYANLELLSVTHAYGTSLAATTSYTYDPATLGVTTTQDPSGATTTNTYDSSGNILTSADAEGNVTTYSYNALNQVLTKVTPELELTNYSYDSAGNLLSVTDADGNTTSYTYGDSYPGDVTSVTNPDGDVTDYTYNQDGDLTSTSIFPSVETTDTQEYTYDADGRVVCEISPVEVSAGVSCPDHLTGSVPGATTTTYTLAGNVASATDALGETTSYTYDQDGNQLTVVNPDGQVTRSTYDADGRLISETLPTGSETLHAYDIPPGSGSCSASVAGTVYCTTSTDASGHVTTDYLNALGELVDTVAPGGATTSYTYDVDGDPSSITEPTGVVVDYTYTADRQIATVTYSDGTPTVAYTYDADGQVTSMVDGSGTTTYSYNGDGKLTEELNGASNETDYTYDAANNVTSIRYPNGQTVSRTFDGAGELASVTDWLGNTTTFSYDANGNLIQTNLPNEDSVTSSFDADNRESSTTLTATSNPSDTLAGILYTRNADGQVTTEADSGALTGEDVYAYNNADQLTSDESGTYSYSANGDPTNLAGATQTFNASDELVSQTDDSSTTTYTYDAAGDRLSLVGPAGNLTYRFNGAGELNAINPIRPTVAKVAPNTGSSSGGTRVIITGSDFIGVTSVKFGSTLASEFTVVNSTEIAAVSPRGTGAVGVTVTTPGGVSPLSSADTYTFVSSSLVPKISSIKPSAGKQTGGTAVTITGTNFGKVLTVSFGTTKTHFTQLSPTKVRAVTSSSRTAGTVFVTVVTSKGTSRKGKSAEYVFVTRPTIKSITPRSGPRAGETKVVIGGTNFAGASAVHFGSRNAKFVVASDTKITATSPAGTGVVNVEVSGPAGSSSAVESDRFTYSSTSTRYETRVARAHQAPRLASSPSPTYFTYNGNGLRISESNSSGSFQFTWNTTTTTPELLAAASEFYVYGPLGEVLEQISTAGVANYLFDDQNHSTRVVTSGTGTLVASYSYLPFGGIRNYTGTEDATSILFDGEYLDTPANLYYAVSRYYDPTTGTFLSKDTLTSLTSQPYTFVDDDPINGVDPSGECGLWGSNTCLGDAWNDVSDAAGTVWNTASDVGSDVWTGATDVASAVWTGATDVGSWVVQNPLEAAGLVLGAVSLFTGVGEVVGGFAFLDASVETLGAISFWTGAAGSAIGLFNDVPKCVNGDSFSCVAAVLDGLGLGLGISTLGSIDSELDIPQELVDILKGAGLGAGAFGEGWGLGQAIVQMESRC